MDRIGMLNSHPLLVKSVNSALLLFVFFAYSLGFFVKKTPFDKGFLGLKNLKTPALRNVSTNMTLMTNSCRSY